MEIKVLGSGCVTCSKLYDKVKKVVETNNIDANLIYEKDMEKIIAYNIMLTPALVINDNVVSKGRIPTEEEILNWVKL